MFNSPLAYCTLRKIYVALDQTRDECAAEQGCDARIACPMKKFFSGGDEACAGAEAPNAAAPG